MGLRTPLYDEHVRAGARLVPFGGWDMPLHYGSQLAEHHAVRRHAGVFDVSHMQAVDIIGDGAQGFLRGLLANDVAKLKTTGKALYSCMLNPAGGVIDDLIVYFLGPNRYRAVVNAATAEKDLEWIRSRASAAIGIDRRDDLAMVAIQGPAAPELTAPLLPGDLRAAAMALKPFTAAEDGDCLVARTGYTGEDGFEIMLPAGEAAGLWQALLGAGVAPCGLGARDTLRLEAGMNLYGQDMDEETGPLESGLAWTIAWEPTDRAFVGREALAAKRAEPDRATFVGLLLKGKGVLRSHQTVLRDGEPVGETTSGGFSPTLGRSIALARTTPGTGETWAVEIRGRAMPARMLKPPFVRHGRSMIEE